MHPVPPLTWIYTHIFCLGHCSDASNTMGLLPDTWNCGLRRECRERFPRHRLQRKPLVSDPDIQHGTCVMHVPWCMSGTLTPGGGENVPGIPGACATRNFPYLARGPCYIGLCYSGTRLYWTYISNYPDILPPWTLRRWPPDLCLWAWCLSWHFVTHSSWCCLLWSAIKKSHKLQSYVT